jgi:hypothetical protein
MWGNDNSLKFQAWIQHVLNLIKYHAEDEYSDNEIENNVNGNR